MHKHNIHSHICCEAAHRIPESTVLQVYEGRHVHRRCFTEGSGQPWPTALSLCIQTLCCGHNENCELCLIAGSEG